MGLIEEIRVAALREAACWDEVIRAGQEHVGLEMLKEEHAQAVGALILLTRRLAKLPLNKVPIGLSFAPAPMPVVRVVPPPSGPEPEEFFHPLKPERTVRRVEAPPPVVFAEPIEKDPMRVTLSDNQWKQLQNLGKVQQVPITDIQRQVMKILVEYRLAWPVGITGAFAITDAGRARLKNGREPRR